MSSTTRMATSVLAVALAMGVLGDALLRTPAFGLNSFLWISCLLAGYWLLARRGGVALAGEQRWLTAAAVLPAIGFLWHDSPYLLLLDVIALIVVFALTVGFGRTGGLWQSGVLPTIAKGLAAGVETLFGPFILLFRDVKWNEIPKNERSAQVAAAVRGLLIALPLLVVFGLLFMAADAVFEHLVDQVLGVHFTEFFSHIIFGGLWAWLVAGFLWAALIQGRTAETAAGPKPQSFALGSTETGMVLGLLNALFFAFVLIQFRYFFGGEALVQASTGLTYAEYARRGFFELVMVAALVLPVLLVGHSLQPAGQPKQERLFRRLAGLLVAQLFIIMASAMQRMWLYQREFGLTELRLYTTIFMIWLAGLFLWFSWTVLRGRWQPFVAGLLLSGFVTLGMLHLLNPDAFIARVNLRRLEAGQRFDVGYVMGLSADAVPVLIEALPDLERGEQRALAVTTLSRWSAPRGFEWRTLNWSRYRAMTAVWAHEEELQALADEQKRLDAEEQRRLNVDEEARPRSDETRDS